MAAGQGSGLSGRYLVCRRLGQTGEELTAGFIDKSGIREDQVERVPSVYSLIVVMAGRGTYIDADGQRQALHAGWCFQRVPGFRHSTILDPDSGWQEAFLGLGQRVSLALLASGALVARPFCWRSSADPAAIVAYARRLEAADETGHLALLSDMLELIAAIRPCVLLPQDAVEQARQWLTGDVLGRRDLHAWCRQKRVGYDRLRKMFRRRYGISPSQYRIARRLEQACALLRYDGQSVARVADLLGYPSPFAFSAQFRAHLGMSPSRYRGG